ncbi:MAG: glycosyltransferase family 39 protein [Pirellulales bacterium]|nr:glycosyltransferase family 39 protein [Pirellulales bacterium]
MIASRGIWLILAAGTVVRVAIWLWLGNAPPAVGDERDYDTLAVNLVEHQVYAFQPDVLTSLRPPLYPLLVAGVYEACGVRNWQAVRGLQIVISLATVWLIYQLGKAIYSPPTALLAAGLTCFYPSLIAYNSLLLTETLFTFLLCASCLAIIRAFQSNRATMWAASGVLLGLGSLTRSILWLLPPLLVLWILGCGQSNLAHRCKAAAAMCLAFSIVIVPWSIRNTRLQHTFITIDVMGGRNLMMGNYDHTPLYRAWDAIGVSGDKAWHRVLKAENPQAKNLTQGQIDKLAMASGLKYMLAHPQLTAQRCLIKFINFWQLEREIVAGAKEGNFTPLPNSAVVALATMIVGSYCLVAFAGVFGLLLVPPSNRMIHYLLLLLIGFTCALHTLTFGHSRYHLPLIPIVALYAAAAIVSAKTIWQQRLSWRFATAITLCTLLALSWGWEFIWADPQRYFGAP